MFVEQNRRKIVFPIHFQSRYDTRTMLLLLFERTHTYTHRRASPHGYKLYKTFIHRLNLSWLLYETWENKYACLLLYTDTITHPAACRLYRVCVCVCRAQKRVRCFPYIFSSLRRLAHIFSAFVASCFVHNWTHSSCDIDSLIMSALGFSFQNLWRATTNANNANDDDDDDDNDNIDDNNDDDNDDDDADVGIVEATKNRIEEKRDLCARWIHWNAVMCAASSDVWETPSNGSSDRINNNYLLLICSSVNMPNEISATETFNTVNCCVIITYWLLSPSMSGPFETKISFLSGRSSRVMRQYRFVCDSLAHHSNYRKWQSKSSWHWFDYFYRDTQLLGFRSLLMRQIHYWCKMNFSALDFLRTYLTQNVSATTPKNEETKSR